MSDKERFNLLVDVLMNFVAHAGVRELGVAYTSALLVGLEKLKYEPEPV